MSVRLLGLGLTDPKWNLAKRITQEQVMLWVGLIRYGRMFGMSGYKVVVSDFPLSLSY